MRCPLLSLWSYILGAKKDTAFSWGFFSECFSLDFTWRVVTCQDHGFALARNFIKQTDYKIMTWSHKTEGDSLRASLFLCCIHLQWISRSLQSHLLHFFLFTAYKTSEEKKRKTRNEKNKTKNTNPRNQKITKNTARPRRRKMQRIGPVI